MDSKLVSVAFEVFVDEKSISGNFIKRSYLSFEKMLFPLVKGLPFELHFILVHQIVFLLKTAVYRCRTCILNKEISFSSYFFCFKKFVIMSKCSKWESYISLTEYLRTQKLIRTTAKLSGTVSRNAKDL